MKTISFLTLKNQFIIELEKTQQKKYLIELELREIDEYLRFNYENFKRTRKHKLDFFPKKGKHIFQIGVEISEREKFSNEVNNYMLSEERKDLEKIESTFSKHTYEQAYEFAEYYRWLKNLDIENSQKTDNKTSSLTHKQKMLALHYLGLDLSKYDNTSSSAVLAEILNLNKENTRKYLSYVSGGKNEVRTKSNLQTVLNLFENQNLTDISNKIKDDLKSFE